MVLLGREQEQIAIDRLLAEARDGRSGVLAVVGEPGIGKTALLEHTARTASGMRLLRARGVESEARVPFAGLAELLGPAFVAIDSLPAPQARALSGALALGPASAGDRFAIGAATLSLLSAYADDGPIVLLIDDGHLLDRSSAEALLFAFRRLVNDPIAVLIAVREGEPSLLDGADLRTLRMGGLERDHAAELLERAGVTPTSAEQLYRATGGNPLALLELAPDAAQLAEGPPHAPIVLSTRITEAFGRRLDRLAEPARGVLLLAAAADSGEVAVLSRAADTLGLTVDDLVAAEEAGLVTLTAGEVEFTHPLVRSAVYAEAGANQRRQAHAALAEALPERDVDRRAWHLASSAVGPDDAVAVALEHAGDRATERSAYAVAMGAYERGARLAVGDELRGRLLLAAADAAWLSGDLPRTLGLLDSASEYASEPWIRAHIDRLRGHVALRRGPVAAGYALLSAAAEEVADTAPELAVIMLAESVHGAFYAGDTAAMVAGAERAAAIARTVASPRATFFASMAGAMAWVIHGDGERGAEQARLAISILERSDELRGDPGLIAWCALGTMFLREAEAGRVLVDRAAEQARTVGAVGMLPIILQHLARDQATTDRWAAAEANLDEAIRLAVETGQRCELAAATAGLAWLQARQGREEACRHHAAQAAELCAELGMAVYRVWAIQALGDLELGLGRAGESAVHHEAQAAALVEHGIADVDLSPAPELVDAYLRLGRTEDAAAVAAPFLAAAEAKGQPWALARAMRCRGLLADDGGWREAFEQGVGLHAHTPDVFEAARTRLAYGARLRRERQRSESREQLRTALDLFERLGARPWADQARQELAASGERARRRDPSTLDDLTPQEFQIARLLAGGMTTREAAAAVFLSPKTVEYHLRNAYRKLGIRSREALAEALKTGAGGA